MKNNNPIGIFDSGVGGLSVWKELIKELPGESVVYYADNAHIPYGPKSNDEIKELSSGIVEFLLAKRCKIIIVACNTATAAAINYLRDNFSVPFIGMEPAVKPAALKTKTKSIAVLATQGTFNGRLYLETSKKFASNINLHIKSDDKLVDIVERNLIFEPETKNYLKKLLLPLIEKEIDHLVLGCTHYPFLIPVIKQIAPGYLQIIDPAVAVVKQTKKVLKEFLILNDYNKNSYYNFFTSGQKNVLETLLKSITNKNYSIERI